MGFTISNKFSFYTPTHLQKITSLNPHTQHTLTHPSIFLTPKIKPTKSFKLYQQISIKHPISVPISCSFSAQREILKSFSEKIGFLLVGSFLFLGVLGAKPVLAQQVSYSESTEQKELNHVNEDEDEEMYLKLLEKEPRNVGALKVLVSGNMKRGNPKEAVKYVERLIDVEPREVEWRLLQALCYEMTGELSKAKKLFKEILKTRPLLLRALHGLAMVMHKNLEGPAVFEMLNKALGTARRRKRVIEERNIRILIAQMHVVKGELEEGLKVYKDLIDENPTDFRPYLCQGIVYSLLDKKKEAEEQFEIYRSLVPEEFPQRGFLDDVVVAAKTESRQQLEKEFGAEYVHKK
ncbi:protein SLOW GREEN 1, chloroplastic [Daucus carota subsp. sativus]|uniref:protein SLOW GREEN 1, chloroplastic n=1 Tax=Daucus carota subsp. sativus TaxID=79200 RepID=UPI0007EF5820|nr:PREDICTED: protein SLOW GREEN 1, chloroplastic [Daucus carota subsp. sativus]